MPAPCRPPRLAPRHRVPAELGTHGTVRAVRCLLGVEPVVTRIDLDATTADEAHFLTGLDELGVPMFVATPAAGTREYHRPAGWQQLDPADNADRLRAWRPGDALCAVLGGPVVALDVDPRNGGDASRTRQLLDGLGVRTFATVRTPGNGAHLYVAGHPDLPTVHATVDREAFVGHPGVELVSFGANAFLPGTQRPKYQGRGYEVVHQDFAALLDGGDPDGAEQLAGWVASHGAAPRDTQPAAPPWTGGQPDRRQRAYLDAAATRQCGELASMGKDSGRNVRLYEAALKLGSLVAGAGLDEQEVRDRLTAAATDCGLSRDDGASSVAATIASGLRNGRAKPKAVPDAEHVGAGGDTGDGPPDAEHADYLAAVARSEPPADAGPVDTPAAVTATPDVIPDDEPDPFARLRPGGSFVLDTPATPTAIWGAGDEVLWADGEALQIVGPQGVGKTTLTAQLVTARIGMRQEVLGWPVVPGRRRVLYLAMDRPRQISRALRRLVSEQDRAVLDECLQVWPGPPPADLAKYPGLMTELAARADADTVIVDSVKDAAIGLTDDEVGALWNRARQHALAAGVEVVEQHHQTKRGAGGQGAPNTLADVYGSVWLTSGTGSVLLLWGSAGDPIVELRHLKQPATEVGPLRIIHDHITGLSQVWHGVDVVLMARRPSGVTAKAAAVAMYETDTPSPAQVEKARRKLDALVRSDHLRCVPGDRGGAVPATWHDASRLDIGGVA